MGLKNEGKATVWEIRPSEKYTDLKVSTSKKNKQTDAWETDFSAMVRCIGEAHKKCSGLKERDKILVKQTETQAKWDKEKSAMKCSFIIWDFEIVNADGSVRKQGELTTEGFIPIPDMDDDALPFS